MRNNQIKSNEMKPIRKFKTIETKHFIARPEIVMSGDMSVTIMVITKK